MEEFEPKKKVRIFTKEFVAKYAYIFIIALVLVGGISYGYTFFVQNRKIVSGSLTTASLTVTYSDRNINATGLTTPTTDQEGISTIVKSLTITNSSNTDGRVKLTLDRTSGYNLTDMKYALVVNGVIQEINDMPTNGLFYETAILGNEIINIELRLWPKINYSGSETSFVGEITPELKYFGAKASDRTDLANTYVNFNCNSSTCEIWRIVGVQGGRLVVTREADLEGATSRTNSGTFDSTLTFNDDSMITSVSTDGKNVFLAKTVKIDGGSGTQQDPYNLINTLEREPDKKVIATITYKNGNDTVGTQYVYYGQINYISKVVNDPNFQGWTDGTNDYQLGDTVTFTSDTTLTKIIRRMPSTLTLANNNITLTYGVNGENAYTYDGDGALSCASGDDTKVTCSVDTTNHKIALVPVAITTSAVTITVTGVDGTNYYAPTSQTFTVTVNTLNAMGSINFPRNTGVREIYFNKMDATAMQNAYDNATYKADLTYNNEGKVLCWQEDDILYIASDGDTYLTSPSFGGFGDLERIVFNNARGERLTSTSSMFFGLSKLKDVNINKLNLSNVTNMSGMFSGCSSLTKLNLSNFGNNQLTNVSGMFNGCTSLKEINMSGFNFGTASVYTSSTNYLFYNLTGLEKIDLTNANMSNVGSMAYLFNNLSNLTELKMSGVNTSNVTSMENMFNNCSKLVSVDLSSVTTSHVTSMVQMFKDCSKLVELDLSGFDTSSITSNSNAYAMFNGCSSLSLIYVSNSWNLSNQASNMPIFNGCTSLVGGNGTVYNSSYIDKTRAVIDTPSTPGYMTLKNSNTSSTVNAMNLLPTTGSFTSSVRNNVKEIRFINMDSNTMDTKYNSASIKADLTYNNEGRVLTWLETTSDSKYIMYIVSDGITYFTTGSQLFMDYSNVERIIFDNINTNRVGSMSYMFYNLTKLVSVNINKFDTSNVTDMSSMFEGCSYLVGVDLSNFDTSKIERMSRMFARCTSLTNINLSNLGGSNLSNVDNMFLSDSSLKKINMSGFDFGVTQNVTYLFAGSNGVESIDLSGAKFYTSTSNLFNGNGGTNLTSLKIVDLSDSNTSNVTSMYNMFNGCTALTSVYLGNIDTSNVTNMSLMFDGCSSLERIYASSNIDTGSVNDSSNMFRDCTSLIGGKGTVFDSNYVDKTYAKIDGGNSNPGYFSISN